MLLRKEWPPRHATTRRDATRDNASRFLLSTDVTCDECLYATAIRSLTGKRAKNATTTRRDGWPRGKLVRTHCARAPLSNSTNVNEKKRARSRSCSLCVTQSIDRILASDIRAVNLKKSRWFFSTKKRWFNDVYLTFKQLHSEKNV